MEKKPYQTSGRRALLTFLKDETLKTPMAAEDIYQGLSSRERAPGRSSVYRMLGALCEEGEVRRFRAGAEEDGFVYQYVGKEGGCSAHLHLQCLSCGRITHLKCHCSEEIRAQLAQTHGFLVDSGRSVLYGTCAVCAKGGAV